MTAANASRCIANTLIYEGGYGKNAKDRGDWTTGVIGQGRLAGTAYGIAAMTLRERGLDPNMNMQLITKDQAIELYKKKEWIECAGNDMPMGLDQITYDGVVNSGKGRGVPWVAKAVGIPSTINAQTVATKARTLTHEQRKKAVQNAIAYRVGFLKSLAIFQTFGVGWMRRCTGMEAIGVKMVLEDAGKTPDQVQSELKVEATKANNKAKTSATAAGTVGAGGGTGVTQAPPVDSMDWTTILGIGAGGIVLLGLIVFLVYQAFKNWERNQAYLKAASGNA